MGVTLITKHIVTAVQVINFTVRVILIVVYTRCSGYIWHMCIEAFKSRVAFGYKLTNLAIMLLAYIYH